MVKTTENKILTLFAFNHKLAFNEIEKQIKERSNKIAYHLKNLVKKGVLIKKEKYYSLSDNSEYLIPYLSEKSAVLPVILIKLGAKNKYFLYKRSKRPYKEKLSLPGGRILIGESILQATERIMKEKFDILAKFEKINSISLEHVKKSRKIIHSFFLILVSARTKEDIIFTDITKNKNRIIPSDYKLLKSQDKEIILNTLYSNI
jgi:ADP-ribose pyrophosphatase YjhB (NUDIX family)